MKLPLVLVQSAFTSQGSASHSLTSEYYSSIPVSKENLLIKLVLTYTTVVTIRCEAVITGTHKAAIGVITSSMDAGMEVTVTTFVYICMCVKKLWYTH